MILRAEPNGTLTELSLDKIAFGSAALPDAPDAAAKDNRGQSRRMEAITDIGYVDGKVIIAGADARGHGAGRTVGRRRAHLAGNAGG